MRVIIADDHPVVRIGLRMLIDLSRTCVIVGEADGPDSLLSLLSTTPCDLLITDFSMPGNQQADGLKMLSTVRRHYASTPIILVTMFANVATLRVAFAQGVMAIVAKDASATELPLAIKSVGEGRRFISESLRTALAQADVEAHSHSPSLSAKEHEVVRMLASGMTVSEIASYFKRSVSTISKQKSMAMQRLGISTDVDLFAYARDNGMVH
ncbi:MULTISPECIES: response regulator transcription factor [Pseudomonas]|jgi:two-component system capsular synthesis response regulator RcsB|uniref:Two-component system, NarL family, captular synthesis response regulator RcsB n=2 Tax=Pseudomonas fluorescens group TaxID=136843 RepID=A0ABY0VDK1_9PSED|nr:MULTISPECIES: response regulator transcription factor [Pseudomonas]MBU0523302.1 response regulator transcription factor [Gammaproteobacteria bacterium]MDF9882915.1 two-component system capsular synthesis response regulator RcsB [Pseudomonas silensiensis]MBU0819732.1 response regulator transcription factor [Gammaproteobacteria bacterium]MBU0842200.1 response regulator transcription factor [Gammaproteobacteria bacterium]MBU1842682.1 response regulator transcription factor [Gammaproteobacteria